MKRVDSLDGLRGVAILFVVGRHLVGFEQGWTGVDIFFVLSGYLITTILLAECEEQKFWKIFYTRRAARILPAYGLLVLLSASLGVLNWRLLWPYLLLFGGNLGLLRHGTEMEYGGFGILWSLAVEEHFYFLWPAQVRRFSRRTLVGILIGVIVLEPVLRVAETLNGANWAFTYYATPFRLDGLAVGALLAILLSRDRSRTWLRARAGWGAGLGLVLYLAAFPWLDVVDHILFCDVAGYLDVSVATALGIAYLLFFPGSLPARLLSWRPLAWLGRISYGVYLFHEIVSKSFVSLAARLGYQRGTHVAVFTFPLTLLLAWLSYRFYERYISNWAKRRIGAYREEQAVLTQAAADEALERRAAA